MPVKTYTLDFAGRKLWVEIGKLAQQANGSVRVQYGETTVLVTTVINNKPKGGDFFPLTVDYEEKYYAAGKIKGSKWIKRETRPSDEAILSGRVIDRSLRPRFDHRIRNEVQVVVTVLSFDGVNDPDMVGLFGASLALMISDIPFDGPIAGVRVGKKDGKVLINPTYAQRAGGDFDIAVAGPSQKINMLEAGANIVSEKDIVQAIGAGSTAIEELLTFQKKIAKDYDTPKRAMDLFEHNPDLTAIVREFSAPRLESGLYTKTKEEFYKNLHAAHDDTLNYIKEKFKDDPDVTKKVIQAEALFEHEIDRIVHKNILESEKRPDGRKLDELRDLSSEVAVLPHVHGSGLFQRGQTQALSVLTLAAPGLEHWVETMEIDLTKRRFMHHYVFPPYSVGETGRMGGGGRREIGHGALAERSLAPIIPSKEEFPYTIRVVSEILGSNGSSSMASVCGSSLALMDGGVPIKTPAAGIAMGLMLDGKSKKYKILTDIQGPEDHHGDMDLKVAGTKDGVTGMQMDVKVEGITLEILEKTMLQARKARLEILDHLTKTIATSRVELSPHAPRIQTITINPEKIGAVIGPQGKVINDIIDKTGAEIDIEDDGSIFITCNTPEGMEKAIAMIKHITYEPKQGDEFDGKVVRLMDFGAFVEITPGKDGMVHVSELREGFVKKVEDVVKVGDIVRAKVVKVEDGRIGLSIKALAKG